MIGLHCVKHDMWALLLVHKSPINVMNIAQDPWIQLQISRQTLAFYVNFGSFLTISNEYDGEVIKLQV